MERRRPFDANFGIDNIDGENVDNKSSSEAEDEGQLVEANSVSVEHDEVEVVELDAAHTAGPQSPDGGNWV
ncbi:hypothetical protein O1611_g4228 [Lasiodiplodia mahajangana]|uniref:Uncharacterized protein n=1 Tax=Lasiodiplodia mahajangana TaxID=1108764 RepID=A0ACC2JPP0_9PEZI|nr:hypothetical protein O1611_g4228 [Lasiodiplodia mahajangana]